MTKKKKVKRKEKGLQKVDTEERRRQIKRLMQRIGWGNINVKELAKELGVSREQIYKDREALLKTFKDEDLEHISFKLGVNYERAIEEAQKILAGKHTDDVTKIKAIRVLGEIQERFAGFLESFGRKPTKQQHNFVFQQNLAVQNNTQVSAPSLTPEEKVVVIERLIEQGQKHKRDKHV